MEKEYGQVVAITLFAKKFSTYALAYSATPLPVDEPNVDDGRVHNTSSGSSSGRSGGYVSYWLDKVDATSLAREAEKKELAYARSTGSGITGIRKDALLELDKSGLRYRHDTLAGNAVQVRVSVDEPGNATKDILVSGYVSGAAVNTTKAKFEKLFPDKKLAVISFDQQGDFGMQVRVAAKVNLSGMDMTNLYFYAYNKQTNRYVLFRPEYWVDSNGYLHFATEYAGDIIISDGPFKESDARDAATDGNWWNPGTGGDGFGNPSTGGDGPGYFIQNIPIQTLESEQLTETDTAQVADLALSSVQPMTQIIPSDSAIKLQIPDAPGKPVALPKERDNMDRNTLILLAIAGVSLVLIGFVVWVIPNRRRRKRREVWFEK